MSKTAPHALENTFELYLVVKSLKSLPILCFESFQLWLKRDVIYLRKAVCCNYFQYQQVKLNFNIFFCMGVFLLVPF